MDIKQYFTVSFIIALGLLILELWRYLDDPLNIYHIPIVFFFLFGVIINIFEIRENYDRNSILLVSSIILALMWILGFTQVPAENTTFYLILGGFTLLAVLWIIYAIKSEEKKQKKLEYYDDILFGNPYDLATLNNKGVELASQGKKRKAMECFNSVLEIDPDDAAALSNKGIIMKGKDYYASKEYIERAENLDPGLEKAIVSGKLILGDNGNNKFQPKK